MGIDSQLIHTCTIERPKTTTDALNAEVRIWSVVEQRNGVMRVRCRLVIKTQRVGDSAFAERPVITTYRLLIPPRTDAKQGDRVVDIQDEEGTVDAGPFAILEVMPRRARAVNHISLLLERTGQDGGS